MRDFELMISGIFILMNPQGTLTFLFTDIARSATHWEREPEGMKSALARHNALLQGSIEAFDGHVFKTWGDAYCAVYQTASDALRSAVLAQTAFFREQWTLQEPLRVRMAVYTGEAEATEQRDYYGPTLNRCARLLGLAHGGHILVCACTVQMARESLPSNTTLRDLGEQKLRGLEQTERVYQLLHPALPDTSPLTVGLNNLTVPELPEQLKHMGKRVYGVLSDFVGKQLTSLQQEFDSNRPAQAETQTEELSDPFQPKAPESVKPALTFGDSFRVLGLPEDTDFDTIRRTCEQLLERCDPSRFAPGSEDQARAKRLQTRVQQAYTVLKDFFKPEERSVS